MSALKTIKITADGSKQMKFNGVEFWANSFGAIMYVPSGEWGIVDQLVSAGLAKRNFYKHLRGHNQYVLSA